MCPLSYYIRYWIKIKITLTLYLSSHPLFPLFPAPFFWPLFFLLVIHFLLYYFSLFLFSLFLRVLFFSFLSRGPTLLVQLGVCGSAVKTAKRFVKHFKLKRRFCLASGDSNFANTLNNFHIIFQWAQAGCFHQVFSDWMSACIGRACFPPWRRFVSGVHAVRPHNGQSVVAGRLRALLPSDIYSSEISGIYKPTPFLLQYNTTFV